MRLPYAPPTAQSPEDEEIYTRIAARRHPRPLIPLDLTLLHAPPLANGYNSFVGAIRSSTVLDQGLLELAISRVAILTNAVYEWNAHAPLALKGGIQPEELKVVRAVPSTIGSEEAVKALGESALSPLQRAIVKYTDQLTVTVRVEDAVFGALREEGLSDREVVELTTGVAGYNCVSRILVSLDVGENNDKEMKSVDELVASL
ncbi:carboxymuconolactone decarboxylase family protein [Aspergillus ruber CBS 135680]|uniref:Putative 4-carboxymuconolactone decarboxylase n=1 Tax=Aspergillus ruber (strain CBS 135680) TaxID=1388766 RepID=A0A017S464_ASPRC|nr:putative 4-carboxymuconolactone decarboxylase [Aspergillus ruber CBS 135680]EYE90970.1 putative 4-carboxymuconolactone decarboxylase [Aspergillus ruber CBS 135680]